MSGLLHACLPRGSWCAACGGSELPVACCSPEFSPLFMIKDMSRKRALFTRDPTADRGMPPISCFQPLATQISNRKVPGSLSLCCPLPVHVRQPEGGEAPAQPSSHPMFPTEGLVTASPPNFRVGTSSPHHTSKLRPTHVAGFGRPEYQAPPVCPGLPTPALPMDSLPLKPPAWKWAQSPSCFQAKVYSRPLLSTPCPPILPDESLTGFASTATEAAQEASTHRPTPPNLCPAAVREMFPNASLIMLPPRWKPGALP